MEPAHMTPDELVVRHDNSRSRRTFWAMLALAGVIWVALLLAVRAFAALDAPAGYFTWVWSALLAVVTALIGFACYLRGTSAGLTQPWRLSARGVQAMTPVGVIVLPWEAVSGVWVSEVGQGWRITIKPKPDSAPGRDGVESDATSWPSVIQQGLSVGGPAVQPGRDEILAAIRHYAGDRVPIA